MAISKVKLPDNSVQDIHDSRLPSVYPRIYVGTCSTAAATAAKVVTTEEFPLVNGNPVVGTTIAVKFTNTNSGASPTLNVNNTGAHSIYYSNAVYTSSGNIAGYANRYSYYVWDGTYWVWLNHSIDSNDNTLAYNVRYNAGTRVVTDHTARYRILFSSADDQKWVPANTGTSTNATSSRTVNQTKINPFGQIVYYASTTILETGGTAGATTLHTQYNLTLGYSFNRTGAALTLTTKAPIYIKCAPQTDGSAIIDADTPYVQALPSTADGKIYIYLGLASSATAVELSIVHPVYYYKDGQIRLWTNAEEGSPVEDKVFVCEYGESISINALTAAVTAGKVCLCRYETEDEDETVYIDTVLCYIDTDLAYFSGIKGRIVYNITYSSDDGWSYTDYQIITNEQASNVHYVEVGDSFSSIYSALRYHDKICILRTLSSGEEYGGDIYYLAYIDDAIGRFISNTSSGMKIYTVNDEDVWGYSTVSIPSSLSQLSDDSTHRLVTDTEKSTWNSKINSDNGVFNAEIGYTTFSEVTDALGIGYKITCSLDKSDYGTIGGNFTPFWDTDDDGTLNGLLIEYNEDFSQYYFIVYRFEDMFFATFTLDSTSGWIWSGKACPIAPSERTTWNAKYTKPSTGIPASDLASGVIPAPEIFWATYGTTTAAEITTAVGAGKEVLCAYNNKTYRLANISDTDIIFTVSVTDTTYRIYVNKTTNVWGNASLQSEWVGRKKTSWSATPSDTNYPSEKLVYDTLQDYALATGDNSYDFAANSIRLVYEPQPGTSVNVPLTFALGRLHVSIPSGGALSTNKDVAFTDDIPTVPTISTNVVTDKASDIKTSSPKSVYDEIHPATQSSQPAGGFLPNVIYNLGTLSGNTTFALATPADSSVANHYYWTFDTGSTAPTITWPASITGWNGGSAPTINASKHYEISVLNGVGAFMEV